MVNNAVRNNPPYANGRWADIAITEAGSDYYYAYCAFSGTVALVLMGMSLTKKRTDRMFFYMCATINVMMCLSYYAMGSNLGMTPISVEFKHSPAAPRVEGFAREIFWVRYVQWFINTPMILLILLFTAGLPLPKLLFTLFLDMTMIIMGLVGAVTNTNYKWGFFAFGCAAMFYVLWTLIGQGRKYAHRLGSDIKRTYTICVVYQLILWICYPVCWGVSEGGNVIAPDSEAVYYGILDILAVPFFSMLLLFLHRNTDLGVLGMRFRDYDDEFAFSHKRNDGHQTPMHGPEMQRNVGSNEAASTSRHSNVAAQQHTQAPTVNVEDDVAHNHGTQTPTVNAGNNTSAGGNAA